MTLIYIYEMTSRSAGGGRMKEKQEEGKVDSDGLKW